MYMLPGIPPTYGGDSASNPPWSPLGGVIGGAAALAIGMAAVYNVVVFYVVKATSSVTYIVLGNFKQVGRPQRLLRPSPLTRQGACADLL